MQNQGAEAAGGYIESLIDDVYQVLAPEELFSRAKKHSWQTFFHHSASVAAISYRLAELYRRELSKRQVELMDIVPRETIRAIERKYGVKFEELAFLVGVVHDYVKLRSSEKKGQEERARELLEKLLSKRSLHEKGIGKVVEVVIAAVPAVESRKAPEARNEILMLIASPVRAADTLMSVDSVDEAVQVLLRELPTLEVGRYIKFGYVKTSAPSLLQARVSKKIVSVLEEHGWIPLAIYYDGLVLAGGSDARTVPLRRVVDVFKEEVASVFNVEEQVSSIAVGLSRKRIAEIYSKLVQTRGKTLLRGDDPTDVYHDMIVLYLSVGSISDLLKYKESASKAKKRKSLLDPRTLATGLEGRGSKYFEEYLGTMIATKESLVSAVLSLKKREDSLKSLFMVLAYMVAFSSEDEGKVVEVVEKAFGVKLPKNIDKDVLYSVAMAEVYKRLGNDDAIKRIVEVVLDVLGAKQDVDYYVSRFVLTSIKSNIIDAESANSIDELTKPVSYRNYCRVCGTPLLSESVAFIEYARAARAGGGSGSEMWLHDDPPLASLEDIATSKEKRIRFICPLCYYEASKLREEEFKPPFLVVALHPAVAYDVWRWLIARLSLVKYAVHSILREMKPEELAERYKDIVKGGYKVGQGQQHEIATRATVIVDFLGARIIVPLKTDMSLKMKDVAQALVLVPYAMSLAGGGQVGLVSSIAHAYNLGSEQLPVVLPHHVPLLYEVARVFDSVKVKAAIEGRDMTPEEYVAYSMSYITILETLYIYSLKVLAWYSRWRKQQREATAEDYALKLLEHMSSIPHAPLALSAPPPLGLDPRGEGDYPLPFYSLVCVKSQEVESRMSQAQKVLGGGEPPSISKAIYLYVKSLSELRGDLSKHAVQKPLRRAIEFIVEFAHIIGYEEARKIAREKFIEIIETSLGIDLSSVKKKIEDSDKREREVTYVQLLQKAFDDISEAIVILMQKQIPQSKLSKFVETLLDVAYERYKSIGE